MKISRVILFVTVIVLIFTGVANIYAAESSVVKLKLADTFPIGHLGQQMGEKFVKRVDELTQGNLIIEYYPAGQMGKLQDMLSLCEHDTVDIAYVPPSFYSGQIPLHTVMILPFWTTAVEGTKIYREMVKECPELTDELLKYNVRPLNVTAISQYDVGTTNRPVRSPEDLKGLRLKSSGGIFVNIAKRYGINPISVASAETYEATRRGIVDGTIFSYASVHGYRLNEILKYHTLGLRMGGFPSLYVINAKTWDELPADYRDAMTRAGKEVADWLAEKWDAQQEALAKKYESEGMQIYRIPKADLDKWLSPLDGIEKEWIEMQKDRNLPSQKIFEVYKRISGEVVNK